MTSHPYWGLLLAALLPSLANADGFTDRPAVQEFIDAMAVQHGFEPQRLHEILAQAEHRQDILDAIREPAEAKPWHVYRTMFVTEPRIEAGLAFWQQHEDILSRAQEVYGIPPHIITAILGVETYYGQYSGTHRVLDALATLAFDYPPRSDFFRSELAAYLLLVREEGLDATDIKGSYAGAMGQAQFISSSYREYAVDFDGDGRRDLWNSIADAVGSVAHYLHVHGWQQGEPLAVPAQASATAAEPVLAKGLKPHTPIAQLARQGIETEASLNVDRPAALVALDTQADTEYWLTFNNFYVITRYNHSPLYAMAVRQLGQAIDKARGVQVTARGKAK